MYYPGGRGETGRHVVLPLRGGGNQGRHTGPSLHCNTWVLAVVRPLRGVICNVRADLCVCPDFRLPVGADLRVCPFPHDHPDNTWAHTPVCPYVGTTTARTNRAHTQVRPYSKVTLRITSPSWILGNTSRPSTTWPKTVYLPSRNGCGSRQM